MQIKTNGEYIIGRQSTGYWKTGLASFFVAHIRVMSRNFEVKLAIYQRILRRQPDYRVHLLEARCKYLPVRSETASLRSNGPQ